MILWDYTKLIESFPMYEPWSSFDHRWPMRVDYESGLPDTVYIVDWVYDIFKPIYERVELISAGVEIKNQTISTRANEIIDWLSSEFRVFGVTIAVSMIGFATYMVANQISIGAFEYGSLGYGEGPYGVGPYGGGEVIKEL